MSFEFDYLLKNNWEFHVSSGQAMLNMLTTTTCLFRFRKKMIGSVRQLRYIIYQNGFGDTREEFRRLYLWTKQSYYLFNICDNGNMGKYVCLNTYHRELIFNYYKSYVNPFDGTRFNPTSTSIDGLIKDIENPENTIFLTRYHGPVKRHYLQSRIL